MKKMYFHNRLTGEILSSDWDIRESHVFAGFEEISEEKFLEFKKVQDFYAEKILRINSVFNSLTELSSQD